MLLPSYFRVARVWVPAGAHSVNVTFTDNQGQAIGPPKTLKRQPQGAGTKDHQPSDRTLISPITNRKMVFTMNRLDALGTINLGRRAARIAVILACVAPLASACAGGGARRSPSASLKPSSDAPKWVYQTSYTDRRKFYGVGVSAGVRNRGLAQSRASNRARNEIAKVLETYSASLMKDYSASVSTGDLQNAQEEQRVEQAIKTFTSQLLVGAEVSNLRRRSQRGGLCTRRARSRQASQNRHRAGQDGARAFSLGREESGSRPRWPQRRDEADAAAGAAPRRVR